MCLFCSLGVREVIAKRARAARRVRVPVLASAQLTARPRRTVHPGGPAPGRSTRRRHPGPPQEWRRQRRRVTACGRERKTGNLARARAPGGRRDGLHTRRRVIARAGRVEGRRGGERVCCCSAEPNKGVSAVGARRPSPGDAHRQNEDADWWPRGAPKHKQTSESKRARSCSLTPMPRRGLHPALRTMTVVLRNGASVRLPTAGRVGVGAPLMLAVVSVLMFSGAAG